MEFARPEQIQNFLDELLPIEVKTRYNQPITQSEIEAQLLVRAADDLLRSNRPIKPIQERNISVSSLGNCSRQVAYGMLPEVYPPSPVENPDQRALWDRWAAMGDIIHTRFQKAFEEAGLLYTREAEDDPAIEGYVDRYMRPEKKAAWNARQITARFDMLFSLGGKVSNGEIKTVQLRYYDPTLPWFAEKLKPAQAQATMFALDLPETIFVVVNRDWPYPFDPGRGYMLLRLKRDDRHANEVLEKAATILKAVQGGTLPMPEPGPNKRNCKLCPFWQVCPAF